ncbi:SRPBCC family protein [Nocardiopsis tropica]|uniref:SRPBCC family protein n=1 Tax=Nocardiopsis tropica TaxID=109330 RepID=A0ABU7KNI7_9ACTN|nr:SRPBCC family protein [Nocardiopsis umidischolae]
MAVVVADRRGRGRGGGGSGELQRVGDTRAFRTGSIVVRERIVELETDRRFVYEALDGPFRSYRGTVELRPEGTGGTAVTWSAVFEPRLRFSGPFWRWYMTRFMQGMADGLAAYAAAPRRR